MNRPAILASLSLICLTGSAFARDVDPCRIRSRQMALAKNCFTGDMFKGYEYGPQFIGSEPGKAGVNYCYNSLVEVEHRPGEALVHLHVLKDGKDGQMHAFEYTLSPDDVKKTKSGAMVSLNGIKGDCFSPTGDREACNGGFLKTIGLKDTNVPFVVGVTKAPRDMYLMNHVFSTPKELESAKPKELNALVYNDTRDVTAKFLQKIRAKLTALARAKMAAVHAGRTTPKRLADTSEQFRYCSMAVDNYIRTQHVPEIFTSEEKNALASLDNYMNNDPNFEKVLRQPASSTVPAARRK